MSTPSVPGAAPEVSGNRRLMVLLADLLGLGNAVHMRRLPDLKPSAPIEGMDVG